MNEKILIIDDDKKLGTLLTEYFAKFSFKVITATHPDDGLRLLKRDNPSLIILDVMLPDSDGFEVCKRIRMQSAVPIIMLTARGDVTDKIVGLELGADDYLAKPFEPRELVARVQSVLRRGQGKPRDVRTFGGLVVDFAKHEATLSGKPLDLTAAEFEVLSLFINQAGRVLQRDEILESLRGIDHDPFNRSVDMVVSRLRQKFNDDPKHPAYFKTIWGAGYMFIGDEHDAP
jgi:DNA-binding response OmpR family regulator